MLAILRMSYFKLDLSIRKYIVNHIVIVIPQYNWSTVVILFKSSSCTNCIFLICGVSVLRTVIAGCKRVDCSIISSLLKTVNNASSVPL